ncbi:MAG: bifunctional adenosylcobinamide kinase/adenosylcobinamide-phosphate guanylyltransferase [Lachnospiraceae bacterium]|nr:bifunctional adenosylcobinamide kinase/adenosylcobinamide-phosphate guanylyltransferase [Lachnospiraceae bacterium]
MKLIIGGYAQGKLNYALQNYHLTEGAVTDAALPEENNGQTVIIYHFHRWVRACIEQGKQPEELIRDYLSRNPDCIIISDEVGNGIVPLESFEREYRERLGRLLTEIAGQSEEVVRVICGIGQRIK